MREITNEQLYKYNIELQQLQGQSVISVLLGGRIKQFYSDNGIRITTLIDKLKSIQEEYLILDEKGQPKFIQEEGKEKMVSMQEGKTVEKFNELTKELMELKITIKI